MSYLSKEEDRREREDCNANRTSGLGDDRG